MKDFLIKASLVFHWFAFVSGIFFGLVSLFGGLTTGIVFYYVWAPFNFLGNTAIGFVIRWLVVGGNIKFFPYQK